MIDAGALAARMAGLEPIGLAGDGTTRLAWTAEDAAARAWFTEQAGAIGLRVERDPAGNLWALPDAPGPWWAVGSHLDSVRGGGRYDGALGVAAAFEAAARAGAPVAVISFADEEGARFNTPTFGSRALVGRLDVDEVLARRDDAGTTLAEAMAADGVDPDGLRTAARVARRGCAASSSCTSTRAATSPRPAPRRASSAALASRMRVHAELRGIADHAGTTRRGERRDALAAAARLIVAADDLAAPVARLRDHGDAAARRAQRADDGPGPRARVDRRAGARARRAHELAGRPERPAADLADRTGVSIELHHAVAQRRRRLRPRGSECAAGGGRRAGPRGRVLRRPRRRRPRRADPGGHGPRAQPDRGVSHAPGEHVELATRPSPRALCGAP